MKPRKFGLIVGILLVVTILIMILKGAANNDEIQPKLVQVVNDSEVAIDLADDASQKASLFELQTQAASIAVTTTSDAQQLQAYYKDHYGKTVKAPKKVGTPNSSNDVVADLKNAQPGGAYDEKFKSLLKDILQRNLESLQFMYDKTKNSQFKDIIKTIYENQKTALESIGG